MWFLLIPFVAHATEFRLEQHRARPVVGHPVLDLRVGVDAIAQGEDRVHPYVCGEVSPFRRFSIEACGNGSGVLHQSDGPDVAHFRVRSVVFAAQGKRMDGSVVVGAGFTEVQRATDKPGFRFGSASVDQVEAAGPEASLGFKGRYWVTDRNYVTADAVAGSAYVPGAPNVMGWSSPVVPFVSFTMGVGF